MPSIPTSPSSAVKKATTNDPAGAVKTEASGQAPEAFKLKNELLKTMVDPKNPWHRVTKARDNAETRTLEQNIASYTWSYAPFPVKDPRELDPAKKKTLFTLPYPPHATYDRLPESEKNDMGDIFGPTLVAAVKGIVGDKDDLYFRLPHREYLEGEWTLKSLTAANRQCYLDYKQMCLQDKSFQNGLNPLLINNIADRDDWYSDSVFAQQQFTGTNPTTITIATDPWIQRFLKVARQDGLSEMVKLLVEDPQSFYVQDNSYFRAAMRVDPQDALTSKDGKRHGCASVSLYRLESTGVLHPIAIVIDYRGDMQSSATIFNRRSDSTHDKDHEETDWPWRYAKMCAQSSDWLRHEVTIHLTNTHLIEEAIIVSAHRTLPPNHIIFRLMKDHWATTISVNHGARDTLIPFVIAQLAGVPAEGIVSFLNAAYGSFDWTGLYIPNDLNKRGFPMESLKPDSKFKNYTYGRNMALMWPAIRKFVSSVVTEEYHGSDADVKADAHLAAFCLEMRDQGRVTSFPQVQTLNELIDMITMCIHIAVPQHTAVNYLQHYYQVFLPNKPPALYKALPVTSVELSAVSEGDIKASLPGAEQLKDWQLGAMLPFMLSREVVGEESFHTYASRIASGEIAKGMQEAGKQLMRDLEHLEEVFQKNSEDLDKVHPGTWYTVMHPKKTANSILI